MTIRCSVVEPVTDRVTGDASDASFPGYAHIYPPPIFLKKIWGGVFLCSTGKIASRHVTRHPIRHRSDFTTVADRGIFSP